MADGQGRKRKTVFEVSQKRRKGVEERNKTRVILGESFIRWRALKTQNGLPTDASVAKFLWTDESLGKLYLFCAISLFCSYYSTVTSTPLTHTQWVRPQPPRSLQFWRRPSLIDMDTRSVSSSGEDETGESSSEEEEDKESASEEEPRELDSDSDSEDQDYFPPICLRSGAVLPRGISLEDYPVVTLEESVHDEPDDDLNKPETLTPPEAAAVLIEEDVIGKPASIVYHDVIKQLLDFLVLPIDRCSVKDRITKEPCSAAKPFEVSVKSRCTALIVEWVCPNGHTVWKWSSQRYFKFGMLAGDFMLGVNILLSGNNYRKTALLFKFMNMGMIDPKTFHKIQDKFCVDTIEDFWKKESATIFDQLKPKESIVLLGDARMDSPGFCAQYCTYSAMENDTKKIISIVNKDKRETGGNSVAMEKISFVNTMDNICKDLPNIKEFCTDANISISAMFNTGQYKDSGVKHSLDIWHGAKNLSKKIAAQPFWYCCKEAESYEAFMDLWTGVLHHVTGVHEWYFGACRHASLDEESQTKEWITKGSAAHHRLQQIVLDARWLKNVPKYLSFRSTAELESFHNHILMYASKRFSFSPPVYKPESGWLIWKIVQQAIEDVASVHHQKQKEYRYIPDLQSAILHSRLLAARGMSEKRPVRLDDPRRLGLLSGAPAPTTEELLQQKASRGLGQPSQP
ncbi:hypothetical protein WMY93_012473 [Mugilogobius chulae]|uniref:Uncharacterized protein n=1 Tax=Mugilogobius chulae TaxID=88201 RepID=A0AAW0P931_9GOBI